MNSGHNITVTQSKLLEMVRLFYEFCIEHNIQYFVVGGTTLGAVLSDISEFCYKCNDFLSS